jgi:hypothetical protein
MTKWIVGSSVAAAFSIAIVSAQVPSQAPTQSPVPTTREQSASPADQTRSTTAAAETITLSGCVANAAGAAEASPAAGAAAEKSDQFVLNVMPQAPAPAAGAAAGAIGTSGSADATMKYNLTGNASLAQYVGKRVEITGTKVEAKGTSGSAADAEAHTSAAQDFRVVSIKPAEGECH